MRWINRAGTALIAIVIVAGPPLAVLLRLQAEQWSLPTKAQVAAWIEQPQAAVAGLIGSIGIAVWLLLVVVIVRHAWRALCGAARRLRRASLPSAAQMTAGSMAGVAAFAMSGIVVEHPAGAAPVATPADTHPGGTELTTPHKAVAQAGIDLPGGGWVPYRTALAVTVLGAGIWLHRRQHYQPGGWRFGQHHHDADLQPLPGTADLIIAVLDEQQPQQATPGSVVLDLPAGLLSLHGPGAMDAARGLLVTALLGSALADSPNIEVAVRPADLKALLGISLSGDMPAGLRTDDPAAFLHAFGLPGGGLDRPVIVIRRLVDASAPVLGRPSSVDRVTAVLIGDGGHEGRRWQVGDDGRITGGGSGRVRRLCLLDEHAAMDLLRLVQQHSAATLPAANPGTAAQDSAPRRGQLRLLGGCSLQVDGSPVQLRRSASFQILAYLAVHSTATTTDLVRAVWPGLEPNTISKRLHTTLTDLRQQLQPMQIDPIVRRDEQYRLNRDLIDTDLDRLRRAIAGAATAVTGSQRQAAAKAIIDAYHGELAAGFSWPWLQSAREALRRAVIDAYLHLAAAAPLAEALDLIQAAIAVDPHNEALHHRAQDLVTAVENGDNAYAGRHGLDQRLLTGRKSTPEGPS
jgi:DNA-binding SARP family transcriptional activator